MKIKIGWNWIPTRLESCGLDPNSGRRRSTQELWQSVNTLSNLRLPTRISVRHSTMNLEWTYMHVNNIARRCFYLLRQLISIRKSFTLYAAYTLIHSIMPSRVDYCNSIFKVPRTLLWENCNPSSTRQPGQSRTKKSSTASLLCWGINFTGFPSVSVSISRSGSLSATPSMVGVRPYPCLGVQRQGSPAIRSTWWPNCASNPDPSFRV